MKRTGLLIPILLTCLHAFGAHAEAARSRSHVVYEGQRLGSIAKRYNVTVDALARANGIRETDPIRPGQRLVIPDRNDVTGARARAATNARQPGDTSLRASQPTSSSHRVEQGQRLESIARRYGVSVDALCEANGIHSRTIIRAGQYLTIPGLGGVSDRAAGTSSRDTSYRAYLRAPKIRDRVELVGYNHTFRGKAFDDRGRLTSAASTGFSRVLATTGSRPKADSRLIRLLVQVSNRFGGRPLRIVSGYRTTSYFEDSKHKASRAVDFSILGVPNEALRDYLRTLPNVGVGYYPNSSFVHLDVREYAAYWVDHSRPGEAPRRNAVARRDPESAHDHGEPASKRTPRMTPTLSPTTELLALERALASEEGERKAEKSAPMGASVSRSLPRRD